MKQTHNVRCKIRQADSDETVILLRAFRVCKSWSGAVGKQTFHENKHCKKGLGAKILWARHWAHETKIMRWPPHGIPQHVGFRAFAHWIKHDTHKRSAITLSPSATIAQTFNCMFRIVHVDLITFLNSTNREIKINTSVFNSMNKSTQSRRLPLPSTNLVDLHFALYCFFWTFMMIHQFALCRSQRQETQYLRLSLPNRPRCRSAARCAPKSYE